MPLSKEDWQDILEHTRKRVREVGLIEIDMQIFKEVRTTESPTADFHRYLNLLISALSERTRSGYQRTLQIFQDCLKAENGKPIDGVEIRIEESDQTRYGTKLISLADQTDFLTLIGELKSLQMDLQNAGLFDEEVSY